MSKIIFFGCVVASLILVVENIAYPGGGFGLLFIGSATTSKIVITSTIIGFAGGYFGARYMQEKSDEVNEEY